MGVTHKLGRPYRYLWAASAVSNLGDGITRFAQPWLASAITRDPLLISLIAFAQRLPWLLFSLPAGVVVDRIDRKRLLVGTQTLRGMMMFAFVGLIAVNDETLSSDILHLTSQDVETNVPLYVSLVLVALVFGAAEVLHDTAATALLPSIVHSDSLEQANGRLWATEIVTNEFVGPALGSALVGIGFALVFLVDAFTFGIGALLLLSVAVRQPGDAHKREARNSVGNQLGIKGAFSWLWANPLLRVLTIAAAVMNGVGMVTAATFVLFAQEVLNAGPLAFAALGMAGAAGGALAGSTASALSGKLGRANAAQLIFPVGALLGLVIGTANHWIAVGAALFVFSYTVMTWNLVAVSVRQIVTPNAMLGRVTSIHRMASWGAMPVGLVTGGLVVLGLEALGVGRELALRLPYLVTVVGYLGLGVWSRGRLIHGLARVSDRPGSDAAGS